MLETALKVLKTFEDGGFEAYIVGGFVRDYLLGIETRDVDICTSATPKEVRMLFEEGCLPSENYGSIVLVYRGIRFEVTTFRKESNYVDHRRPSDVTYTDSVKEDILRRDFTINALLMNSKGEVLDYVQGQDDLKKREIKTIGKSKEKFQEDALRILRAIRFATVLHFKLSDEIVEAISKTKKLLGTLSYERKKQELDCIFTSPNVTYGVSLLVSLGLDEILEIPKLKDVPSFDDLMGVWAFLECDSIYTFSKNEKQLMEDIREVTTKNVFNPVVLYNYGLYVCGVAAKLVGQSKRAVTHAYNRLPIHDRDDIPITSEEICFLLNREEGPFLKDIWNDLEKKILNKYLANEKEIIEKYLVETY